MKRIFSICMTMFFSASALANHQLVITKPSHLQGLQTPWASTNSSDIIMIFNTTCLPLELDISVFNGAPANVQCDKYYTLQPNASLVCRTYNTIFISSSSPTIESSGIYAVGIAPK
jgi:hypothetical protein